MHLAPKRSAGLSGSVLGVTLLGSGFLNWGGGVDFLRLISSGLLSRDDVRRPVGLLYPTDALPSRLIRTALLARAAFIETFSRSAAEWRPSPTPDFARVASWFQNPDGDLLLRSCGPREGALERVLQSMESDVLLPVLRPLSRDFRVPWVGYIYDFQHRYLSELFSPAERARRDHSISRMLCNAPVVIANSIAVHDDVARFYPGRESKVVTLPFTPVTQVRWFESEPLAVCRRYNLPDRFFIVCNQFWVHKDHATALRALHVLRDDPSLRDFALVCTGKPEDYRAPGHFASLQSLIRSLGLDAAVRLLGHIPKDDQLALVRAATAVVQPTLFEGGPGGGAAYDAVAVGTPLIASDIPVNREIDLGEVRFFEPGNELELAAKMIESIAPSTRPSIAALLERSQARVRLLGDRLIAAASMAIHSHDRRASPHA